MFNLFKAIALVFFLVFAMFWIIGVLVVALVGTLIALAWKNSTSEPIETEKKK